jgi:hypothetical protein
MFNRYEALVTRYWVVRPLTSDVKIVDIYQMVKPVRLVTCRNQAFSHLISETGNGAPVLRATWRSIARYSRFCRAGCSRRLGSPLETSFE